MKRYKIPFWSKVASLIAQQLPYRIHAWIWINAYDSLQAHYRHIHELEEDGVESYYDGISAIRVENLRRGLFRNYLKATLVEKETEK